MDRKQAEHLAHELFKLGDELNSECTRIEFKGGKYGEKEKSQGGLCFSSLVGFFEGLDINKETTNKVVDQYSE